MNSHVRHVRCGCLDCFSTTVADSHNLSCSLYSFIPSSFADSFSLDGIRSPNRGPSSPQVSLFLCAQRSFNSGYTKPIVFHHEPLRRFLQRLFIIKCVRGKLSLHLGESAFENVKKWASCSWRWIGLICYGQCTPRAAKSILPLVTASRSW